MHENKKLTSHPTCKRGGEAVSGELQGFGKSRDIMQKLTDIFRYSTNRAIASLCLVLGCSPLLWSQQQRLSYTPSTAIDQEKSRAEQEAEQLVSLSADKITQILQNEPGLLLQVKKALVRKAFEQGRILDPNDLTDDAVFRLLRDDQNVRVIATREIEDRSYIRAKPTREELARNLPCQPPISMSNEALAKEKQRRKRHPTASEFKARKKPTGSNTTAT